MLARVVRSGVAESFHDGAIAVVDTEGRLIARHGDIHRVFFARSSVKPFQAYISQSLGADLPPEWLAVACASHGGAPVQLGIVESILGTAGLSESDLLCPPSWPAATSSRFRVLRAGEPEPRRLFHVCSGKHAAFLRACRESSWDLTSYVDPDHPLQVRVLEVLRDVTAMAHPVVGVDGCGAPTPTISTLGLARAFSRLGNDEQFRDVLSAMHRFPRLLAGIPDVDAETAIAINAAAKRGAEGNLAVAVPGRGGIAIRVFDGADRAIGPVVAALLSELGWVTPSMGERITARTRVPMSGGDREVGSVEPLVDLVYP